jgi:hypothetical protein
MPNRRRYAATWSIAPHPRRCPGDARGLPGSTPGVISAGRQAGFRGVAILAGEYRPRQGSGGLRRVPPEYGLVKCGTPEDPALLTASRPENETAGNERD